MAHRQSRGKPFNFFNEYTIKPGTCLALLRERDYIPTGHMAHGYMNRKKSSQADASKDPYAKLLQPATEGLQEGGPAGGPSPFENAPPTF